MRKQSSIFRVKAIVDNHSRNFFLGYLTTMSVLLKKSIDSLRALNLS